MAEQDRPDDLELVFTGRFAEEHHIPASVLTQVVEGMQRTVHLLGMEQEGVEVRRRDRVSREIERKYVLLLSELKPGCVVIGARIGDPSSDLFAADAIAAVARRFEECAQVVSHGSVEAFSRLIPDRVRRLRILEAFRSMVPKKGTGVGLVVRKLTGAQVLATDRLQAVLKDFLPAAAAEPALQTVTGRLARIDFDERKLTVIYPVTNRELECFYQEAVEDLLLDNPRELIQVTGTVILDEEDHPKRIVDVQDIREVDLSPFYLTELRYADYALRFRQPLTLTPDLDETQQLLCLAAPALGIDVCAATRDELDEVLSEEIDVLWRNYAREADDRLTEAARELKARLRAALEEVGHAAG